MYFWYMKVFAGIIGFIWKCWVAIVFFVFAILFYPFFLVLVANEKWKKGGFYIYILWSWMIRIFCLYGVKKVRRSPLPPAPYIIISNHSSYLDIFLMYSIFPKNPFLFLGKGEILSYPIVRTYFKSLNIPVHRKDRGKAAKSFIQAKKEAENGWSLVIFPEGGIPDHHNPKMMPFKDGAFKLAKSLSMPIIPLTFTNHFHLFSDPTHLLGPAHPGISRVYIHPTITPDEMADLSVKELKELCFERINEPLRKEYPERVG
jgi:1-acyl-sn-glycerol-3-phosphate acyltransferase